MPYVHPEVTHGDHFSFCNPIRTMTNPPTMWTTDEIHENYGSDFISSPRWNHISTGLYTTPIDDGTEKYYYYLAQSKSFTSNLDKLDHLEDTSKHQTSLINAADVQNSVYELSLRDLVELPRIAKTARENQNSRRNDDIMFESRASSLEERNQKPKYSRSKSMGNGWTFLLKVFFQASMAGRKKSFSKTCESYNILRPKHVAADGDHAIRDELNDSKKMMDELTIDRKSRSRCYSFFQLKKSKSRHV